MLNDTRSVGDVTQDVWRVRVAVALDLMIGVATLVMLGLALAGISRLAAPLVAPH